MRTRNYLFYLLRDPCFSQVVASVNMSTWACQLLREKIHTRCRSFTHSLVTHSFACVVLCASLPFSQWSSLSLLCTACPHPSHGRLLQQHAQPRLQRAAILLLHERIVRRRAPAAGQVGMRTCPCFAVRWRLRSHAAPCSLRRAARSYAPQLVLATTASDSSYTLPIRAFAF